MQIGLDPLTTFLALVTSTTAAAMVLLWCYWLNRGEKSLLWTAIGFFSASTATFVLAGRDFLPESVAIAGGGSLLMFGASALIIAGLSFSRKAVPIWLPFAGPLAWLAACSVPAIYNVPDYRVVALSALTAIAYFIAACAFFVRDGLLTRVPLVALLTIHGFFCLSRIPMTLFDEGAGLSAVAPLWFSVSALETLVFIQFVAFFMVSLTKERVERRLSDAAHTDQLTGLGNRRAFFLHGEGALALATRNKSPFSIVVFDLDRFKAINDAFGHPTGDAVIQAFARAASARLRASDFIARLGGEEFAAILPGTSGEHAGLVALHINQAFEKSVAELGIDRLACTASAGVARVSPGVQSLPALMSVADRALYEAKSLGRGQVRLAAPVAPALLSDAA